MNYNSSLALRIYLLATFAGPFSCAHAAPDDQASYGVRVKYRSGEKIKYADFTIEYLGEHRKSTPAYPRGFLYYDFKVWTANIEKVVSWSSGTDDIGPVEFEIGGKQFRLELHRSDKLGKLNENELVIWKSDDAVR